MAINVAINGFGRIGRDALRILVDNKNFNCIAVVSTTDDSKTMRHLFKYDSISGGYKNGEVVAKNRALEINGKEIKLIKGTNPKEINWRELGIDIVIECSGKYRTRDEAATFLEAGAKKIVVSAPCKQADATIVMGINENKYNPDNHNVISNASCTTNCLAPMVKVMLDNFGIKKGMMTTVHSYTRDQMLLDSRHKKDLRRARAAALSMIPTSTGAADAVGIVIPEIKGKLNGIAIRVPVADVSIVDLALETEKNTTIEEINKKFKEASESYLKGILQYCEEPLVSSDFIGNSYSSIFDSLLTDVIGGNFVKIFAWYDNEWGYANRLIDLTNLVGNHL